MLSKLNLSYYNACLKTLNNIVLAGIERELQDLLCHQWRDYKSRGHGRIPLWLLSVFWTESLVFYTFILPYKTMFAPHIPAVLWYVKTWCYKSSQYLQKSWPTGLQCSLDNFLDNMNCSEIFLVFNVDVLYRYSRELIFICFLVMQIENLADFYECCKGLDLTRNFQFPSLRQVPFFA